MRRRWGILVGLGLLLLAGVVGWRLFWRFDPAVALPRREGTAAVLHLSDGNRAAESWKRPLPWGPFPGTDPSVLAPLTRVLGECAFLMDGRTLWGAFLVPSARQEDLKALLEGRTSLKVTPPAPKGSRPTWRLDLPSGERLWIRQVTGFPAHLYVLADRPEGVEEMVRAYEDPKERLELDRKTEGADYLWFRQDPGDDGQSGNTEVAWGGDDQGVHLSWYTTGLTSLLGEWPEGTEAERIDFPGTGDLVGVLGLDGALAARMAEARPEGLDAWFRLLFPRGDLGAFLEVLRAGRITLAWVLPPGATKPRELLCLQGKPEALEKLRDGLGAGAPAALEGFEGARILEGEPSLCLAWREGELWMTTEGPEALKGTASVPEALKDLPAPVNPGDLILDGRGLEEALRRMPLPGVLAGCLPDRPVGAVRVRVLGPSRGDGSLFFRK